MSSSRKGLLIRFIASLWIALIGSLAYPVADILNWPIGWVWSWFYPTWDTNLPFIPFDSWRALGVLLLFAVPIYTTLLYVPNLVMWLISTTRVALRLPGAFLVYFVAGALLGAMLGVSRWTESLRMMSRHPLFTFAGFFAIAVGWGFAVGRSYVELWRNQDRSRS
jgi:hypothetical protein